MKTILMRESFTVIFLALSSTVITSLRQYMRLLDYLMQRIPSYLTEDYTLIFIAKSIRKRHGSIQNETMP
ncbi:MULTISPECIES: hypothetical protein [Paenibacillus]|uniref:Uncharacterized protein n=1 Tax=Paenibacillus amylolyticus TaxID=1451 RepID=A0AAP5GXB9_PAEAM|nr:MULTISPECIES: hypothetical protein [Paenibacillus]MDR6721937.1 hypothetical protein [Paenibacillus amylolyticus]